MKLAIQLHVRDNVATATETLGKGDEVSIRSAQGKETDRVSATDDLPLPFHKIALADIPAGAPVYKYGEVIGYAWAAIARGGWVHVHNLQSANLPEEET